VAAYFDTLAAAYAATGRFNDAITTAQKAIELAKAAGQSQLVEEAELHLKLYRSGQPYHQPIDTASPHSP
jgi:spermidine synthase